MDQNYHHQGHEPHAQPAGRLILVRHAAPRQDPAQPASRWQLSEAGRLSCARLAERLAAHAPGVVVTSAEPKAVETGALVAARLGLPTEQAEGLHEHRRERVPFTSLEQFERSVAALFERPDELALGEETARQAADRFERAVRDVLARHPAETVAVVAHGTVITLFVARHAGLAPVAFWRRLGLPAVVVMSLPGLELLELIERV